MNSKLDIYFEGILVNSTKVQDITTISAETGISISTISRYAKKRGFMNFSEMRAVLTRNIGDVSRTCEKAERFKKFFQNKNKILIFTSLSTRVVGLFIFERFKALGKNVTMVEDYNQKQTPHLYDGVLVLTISGESARVVNFLKENQNSQNTLLITCATMSENWVISLTNLFCTKSNNINFYRSLRAFSEWIQDQIDQMEIKQLKNYSLTYWNG